jgi:DNA polymerase-3 subunit epsilon
MKALFYDTESSRMPLFDQPSGDPRQPHIVQVAAALIDTDTRQDLAALNFTVMPTDWSCDPETQAIHGITPEVMAAIGISESLAVRALLALWEHADIRVGHVESFDCRMVRIACKRFVSDEYADRWKAGGAVCTKVLAGAHDPAFRKKGAGDLMSVHRRFVGHEFDGAHTAEADMRATARVYFAMLERGHV